MVGNAMYITGGGSTTGWYFVTGYTSASTVTLDRSPGSSVSGATWHLGGGWADYQTNTTSSGPLVPGNTVYILGSGIPNPSSYTYDYSLSGGFNPASGNTTGGYITYAADPNTPNYSTGGMPCIQYTSNNQQWYSNSWFKLNSLWFVPNGAFGGGIIYASDMILNGVVYDGFGYDGQLFGTLSFVKMIGCEVFSSVSKRSTNSNYVLGNQSNLSASFEGCNFHDNIGPIFEWGGGGGFTCVDNIFAKNGGDGLTIDNVSGSGLTIIKNNTIDGNLGHGLNFTAAANLGQVDCHNNIISNHTQSGKYGINVGSGTAAANNKIAMFLDYNTFYNNTNDLNNLSYGAHDTSSSGSAPNTISATPYVASSTENYALA